MKHHYTHFQTPKPYGTHTSRGYYNQFWMEV